MTEQTIENLDIDGVSYSVADLPEDVQAAVSKYEDWRERFAMAQDEAALVGSALRDLGAQIVAAIRANEAATEAAEEVEAPAEESNTLVVEDDA